jgi:hypothetical protein
LQTGDTLSSEGLINLSPEAYGVVVVLCCFESMRLLDLIGVDQDISLQGPYSFEFVEIIAIETESVSKSNRHREHSLQLK